MKQGELLGVIRFEKEFMGRGPLETKAYLLDDLVVVRLRGVLTAARRAHSRASRRCSRSPR